ncbi:MAG: ABC transporter ATP-binding protein, partial [Alphaproteobacteria bacterium]
MMTLPWSLAGEWRAPIRTARRLGILRPAELVSIAAISLIAVVFETFGIGMLLPIMQLVENGGDAAALIATSRLWQVIAQSFDKFGIEVGLLPLSLLVLVLLTLRQVSAAVRILVVEKARAQAAKRLSEMCFSAILSSRGEYLQRVGSGKFSILVSTQAQSGASVIRNLAELFSNGVTVIGYGIIMASVAFVPTLIALAFGVLTITSVGRLVRMTRRTSDELVSAKANFAQFLVERQAAWRLVKASNSIEQEKGLTRRHATKLAAIDIRLAKISVLMNSAVVLAQAVMVLVILNLSVRYLDIEIATITLLFVAMIRLMPIVASFTKLRQVNAAISAFLAQVVRFMEASEQNREVDDGSRPFTPLQRAITFDKVSFSYLGSEAPALHDLSVSIPARRITAITGPSGAGKSTLVDILPRLIVPQSGMVQLDGVAIEEFSLNGLRGGMHYVGQTPLLMNGTVIDNVRYARKDATREEVIEACRQAHAHDFVTAFPDGYDTPVGEGGTLLSGGQRQRLALARAFLSTATIVIL